MTYKIVADTAPKPSGAWRYMVSGNGRTVWATTATEAVAAVINTENPDAYLNLSNDEAFLARYQFVLSVGKSRKLFFQALSIDGGTIDGEELPPIMAFEPSEAEINAMGCDITEPVVGLPDNTWYIDDYPLIINAADYEPYSDIPMPHGRSVVVLDPIDERTFLMSLSDAGIWTAQAF